MGMINHETPFDDTYSQEIIGRLRKLSPELDEYVITERYLTETEKDNLSPLWLRNRLLIKAIDQLSDRGILINKDPDDIVDAPALVELVVTLREKFDQDRFYDFLKDHQSICEDLTELIDDDCISDLVHSIAQSMTLSEDWIMISQFCDDNPGILMSNGTFNDLVTDVLERCARLGDADGIQDDSDMTRLIEYTKYLSTRKNRITSIACDIYDLAEDGSSIPGNVGIMTSYMSDFESELGQPKVVRKFLDNEFMIKSFVEKERELRVRNWKHCLEYWTDPEHQQEQPTYLNIAMLVATLIVDAPDPSHARVYVLDQFESYIDQYGDRYANFRKYIDRALGNLVIKETLNNEIK